jgi:hypothetical protein
MTPELLKGENVPWRLNWNLDPDNTGNGNKGDKVQQQARWIMDERFEQATPHDLCRQLYLLLY